MSLPPSALVHRTNSGNETQSLPGEDGNQYGDPHQQQQQHQHRRFPDAQRTTSKPLNFKKAMDDFQIMFPEIDRHAIESVLRANNGVVQSTIDQLLILQESCVPGVPADQDDGFELGGLPSYESSIFSGEEPPPAYSAVWEEPSPPSPIPQQQPQQQQQQQQEEPHYINEPINSHPVLNREESIKKQSLLLANSRWKAPLVGELPSDFLRMDFSAVQSPPPPSLNNLR